MFTSHAVELSEVALVNESLFNNLADDIYSKGYSVLPNALPSYLADGLYQYLQVMPEQKFDSAGTGRDDLHIVNQFVRTDEICWINGDTEIGTAWLKWTYELQQYLNRRLFLGLFSFESHFAHYAPGDFYKTHLDAFKGEANRVLSVVVYLNPQWNLDDGGELVIYLPSDTDVAQVKVTPSFATIVAFLSEDFPHEVLPATRDRYSIAGWYRLNTSQKDRVDPPK
ncbi:2OG-Fe(II) oxygenase [Algibacillus agarilyticus]|uniref:2OG-Fe(II) oxygenase n=1 Tax=Algibacillus agarilyticus TaxID=2234133 RepID=UPI000DD0C701|nr:2OG-Fe(II) oxygenase [Algibacillus agarilyticus]